MGDLETFRDHCRRMAQGGHTSDCPAVRHRVVWRATWLSTIDLDTLRAVHRGEVKVPDPPEQTRTCATEADRALFGRLADEVDTYLTTPTDIGQDALL